MIEERLPLSFLFHSTTLLQERNRASLGHRATASAMVRETLFKVSQLQLANFAIYQQVFISGLMSLTAR